MAHDAVVHDTTKATYNRYCGQGEYKVRSRSVLFVCFSVFINRN